MRVGIDASNLRAGGGITHLKELLRVYTPDSHGVEDVVVWAGSRTLANIAPRPWLQLVHESWLDRALPIRLLWQQIKLESLARDAHCDVLYVPGGSYSGSFRPFVTMSRNLLPFEWAEIRRFGLSWMSLKLLLLRYQQQTTFQRADGLIFMTDYARTVVSNVVDLAAVPVITIPHGINPRFRQKPLSFSADQPVRILYVSTISNYKHQCQVVRAVSMLRNEGVDVTLDLVGSAYPPALRRLKAIIDKVDPGHQFIHYRGKVTHEQVIDYYHRSDIFVFASTVENMPNILVEAMAAGLPIASSDRGPMPEILGDGGVYINPEEPESIAGALRHLLLNPDKRHGYAQKAYARSTQFSWERCAEDTFAFLQLVAQKHHSRQKK